MASVIVFLAYSFLMFQAGYQWHKWAGKPDATPHEGPHDSKAVWTGMVGKI